MAAAPILEIIEAHVWRGASLRALQKAYPDLDRAAIRAILKSPECEAAKREHAGDREQVAPLRESDRRIAALQAEVDELESRIAEDRVWREELSSHVRSLIMEAFGDHEHALKRFDRLTTYYALTVQDRVKLGDQIAKCLDQIAKETGHYTSKIEQTNVNIPDHERDERAAALLDRWRARRDVSADGGESSLQKP